MGHPVCYEFGSYRLDVASRELWCGDTVVSLPYRAFDCLVFLLEHRDRAVGRDELVTAIWGHTDISDAQLGQIVLRARRAVGDDGNAQSVIRTIPRFGYRWVADTQETIGEAAAEQAPPATEQPLSSPAGADQQAAPAEMRPTGESRYLLPALVVGIALLLVAALLLLPGERDRPAPEYGGTLVLPVVVEAGDEHGWLRLGIMDMIAGRLRAGGVAVPASESMLSMLQAHQNLDTDAELWRAATGAERVIAVHMREVTGGWRLHLVAAHDDAAVVAFEVEAGDALAAAQQASDRLLLELGHPAPVAGDNLRLEEVLQRAQAALLGNQLEAARVVLENAPPHLHDDPRLRYHRARLDVRAGRWPEVRDAMEAMLADGIIDSGSLLHGQVLTTLGTAYFNLDQAERAEHYIDLAIDILERAGDPAELGRALGLRGGARGAQRRYDEAFTDFSNARIQLGQAGDRLLMARLDLLMASFEQARARPQRARPLLERGVVELESLGAINELLYGFALLVRAELAELEFERAQAVSNRAWAFRSRTTDPESRFVMAVDRATVFEARGRLDEAEALLAELAEAAQPPNPWAVSLSDWMRARLALLRGQPQAAVDYADAALRRLPAGEHQRMAAHLALLRQRGLLMQQQDDQARAKLQAFEAARVSRDASSPGPVALDVARGELAAALGEDAAADKHFAAALAHAQTDAVPRELVLVADAYGRYLLDRGRLAEAGTVIGQVAPWADRDYDSALLQVALYQALGPYDAWSRSLRQARELAGQRALPPALEREPAQLRLIPEE